MGMQVIGQVAAGSARLDTAITDFQAFGLPRGAAMVYAGTAAFGGVSAWQPVAQSLPLVRDLYSPDSSAESRLVKDLAILSDPSGAPRLLVAGGGGLAPVALSITDTGTLRAPTSIDAPFASAARLGTMLELPNRTLVATDLTSKRLYVSKLKNGEYSVLKKAAAVEPHSLTQVVDLDLAVMGEAPFVIALDAIGHRVTVLSPRGGGLRAISSYGAREGGGMMSPTELETVMTFGKTFIVVASAAQGAGGLTVLEMDAAGQVWPVDQVLDSLHSRFGQVQDIAVLTVGEKTFVAAGGGDDGVSLFGLLPSGRLVHLAVQEDNAQSDLIDVSALELVAPGGDLQIWAAGQEKPGFTVLDPQTRTDGLVRRVSGGPVRLTGQGGDDWLEGGSGNDTLEGAGGADLLVDGQGEDVLRGGDGADLFVLVTDGAEDHITDFDPRADMMDLSAWQQFYDPAQVSISVAGNRARLTWRDEVLWLSGTGLDALSIRAAIQFGPHRAPDVALFSVGGGPGEHLTGSNDDDELNGSKGNDLIEAFSGADRLFPGQGNDTLDGGAGDDTVWGGLGHHSVELGDGHDQFLGQNEFTANYVNVVFGRAGNDFLRGGGSRDELWGCDGDDRIEGLGGDDSLGGGWGYDDIFAGDGNDTVWGGNGRDEVFLGNGHDEYWDTAQPDEHGRDTVHGDDGDDTIHAGGGDDWLLGGSGHDHLTGEGGYDHIYGHDGNDRIWAGDGNDTADGGAGNDTVWGGTGTHHVELGTGDDQYFGQIEGTGQFTNSVFGREGNDFLRGGDSRDELWGCDGDDHIEGLNGDDSLGGGWGNDDIFAGNGNDTVWGGLGRDEADLGEGDDAYWDIDEGGADGRDTIRGGGGNDTIGGGGGDDLIYGGHGSDHLIGSGGHDVLFGYLGDDQIWGGAGRDTLIGEGGADRLAAGEGHDLVYAGDGQDIAWLQGGDDRYSDTREGGIRGRDTVFGDAGNDVIATGGGDDELFGGSGNDTLHGEAGDDLLDGGGGHDEFVFAPGSGSDTIQYFDLHADRLAFENITRSGLRHWTTEGDTHLSWAGGELVIDNQSHAMHDLDLIFV